MSSAKWVCFSCRTAVRRLGSASDVRCPSCACQCENLGCKVLLPPKANIKCWIRLRDAVYYARRAMQENRARWRVRKQHDLEHEITRLRTLPVNAGRKKAIKNLEKCLLETHMA